MENEAMEELQREVAYLTKIYDNLKAHGLFTLTDRDTQEIDKCIQSLNTFRMMYELLDKR